MKNEGNSAGTVSVILGILSILSVTLTFFAIFAPIHGLILGVLALFFALSQKKSNKNSWSKAGLYLAIIGIIINFVVLLGFISVLNNLSREYQTLCDVAGGCENIPAYLQSQQLGYG